MKTYTRFKGGTMNRQEKAIKWDMCHKIINTVRKAKEMELSKEKKPHRGAKEDNWIDLAGYAACGGEIEGGYEKMKEHASKYADELLSGRKEI